MSSIDPRDDSPRACRVCEERDVHPMLKEHCGPCHMDWCGEWMSSDDALVAQAEAFDEPVLTIEVEEPRTSSGEWTVDVGDIGTVDANGNPVSLA